MQRVRRHARALIVGVAAAGVVVVVGVVAVTVWPSNDSAGGTAEAADGPAAFYLEAVIEVDNSWALTVGTNIASQGNLSVEAATTTTALRQWFEPPNRWRWRTPSAGYWRPMATSWRSPSKRRGPRR